MTTRKILTESVWRVLNEDTRSYLNRFDRELLPLLEEYKQLVEAELSQDQIAQLFQDAEKYAVDSGNFKSGLGKAGDKATQAGKAVMGAVKVGNDVVKKVNDKINELGRMIQDTAPVQGIDQAFEKAKMDLFDKLGGKDSKVNQMVMKMSQLAKDHPGKTKFLVGVLTTAAAMAAGPAGGAIAGYVLRGANELLKGEKLSTTVGKGLKTAAMGYAAGKATDFVKDQMGIGADNVAPQGGGVQGDTAGGGVNGSFRDADGSWDQANVGADADAADAAIQARDAGLNSNPTGSVTSTSPIDVAGAVTDTMPDVSADEIMAAVKNIDTSDIDPGNELVVLRQAARDIAQKLAPNDPPSWNEMEEYITMMARSDGVLDQITQHMTDSIIYNGKPLVESLFTTYTLAQLHEKREFARTKQLSGLKLTESEQALMELGWNDIKKGASKAAKSLGGVAKKAGDTIAKKAKSVSNELGQTVTAKKLTKAWTDAGSPTDAQSVANILGQQGLSAEDIATVTQGSGIEMPSPATPAEEPQQADANGDTTGEPIKPQSAIGQATQQAQQAKAQQPTAAQPGDGVVQAAEIAQVDKAQDGTNKVEPGEQNTWMKILATELNTNSLHPKDVVKFARKYGATARDEKVIMVLSNEKMKSNNAMYSRAEVVELYSRLLDPPGQAKASFEPDQPVKYTNKQGKTGLAKVVANLPNGMVQLTSKGAKFAIDPKQVSGDLSPQELNLVNKLGGTERKPAARQ